MAKGSGGAKVGGGAKGGGGGGSKGSPKSKAVVKPQPKSEPKAGVPLKATTDVKVNFNGKTVSDQKVKDVLGKVADLTGGTVKVGSGDRTHVPKGGSKTSHHLAGRAADIHVQGLTDKQVFDKLRQNPGKVFLPSDRYQVIHHGPHTFTGAQHVHIGRYADGKGVSFWLEGKTPGTKGKYTRLE
jgi:hypothetical protein